MIVRCLNALNRYASVFRILVSANILHTCCPRALPMLLFTTRSRFHSLVMIARRIYIIEATTTEPMLPTVHVLLFPFLRISR
jgi:hypothetical protein